MWPELRSTTCKYIMSIRCRNIVRITYEGYILICHFDSFFSNVVRFTSVHLYSKISISGSGWFYHHWRKFLRWVIFTYISHPFCPAVSHIHLRFTPILSTFSDYDGSTGTVSGTGIWGTFTSTRHTTQLISYKLRSTIRAWWAHRRSTVWEKISKSTHFT